MRDIIGFRATRNADFPNNRLNIEPTHDPTLKRMCHIRFQSMHTVTTQAVSLLFSFSGDQKWSKV